MLVTKAARVYAKALMDLALEQGKEEAIKGDMEYLQALWNASRPFESLMRSPVAKSHQKQKVLDALLTECQELSRHYVALMVRHRRESLLNQAAEAYLALYRKHKGISRAIVTTAIPLDEAQMESIRASVAGQSQQTVELENKVDPSIIGGMILRMGDQRYNGSLAAEIKRLRREFAQNQYVADF